MMSTYADRYRILHPITRLIVGGAQENTMLTADLMDKTRWDVEVISGPQTGSEGSLIESVHERGIPLTIEPSLVRELNPLKDPLALLRLTRFIRKGNYAVVHTHSSKAGVLGRWAAKFAGTPIIVHTVHGWGHHERQHPFVRWFYITLEKLTLTITDKLIVVSGLNIDKGIRDGIGKIDDYVVIRSGIEFDRFGAPQKTREEMRATLGIPNTATVVGTVTRLSPQKAPLDFVEAAAIIAADFPDAYFIMVGDGPLRLDVEHAIEEFGLASRIILTGLRRDIPEIMTAFDIFALSSLWEGLPRVLPQAMMAGLPVVATATDGNAEIVQDYVNGLLVEPGRPTHLANALVHLLQNPDKAQQMGQNGREMVEEYDASRMVDQIEALYRELIGAKQVASD